ncbi:MAG: hypothetical protein GY811_01510 [Myxococcales bacterium]|nr:hypothetical protein [Myxococcales bacterium]
MSSNYQSIRVERDEGIVTVVLNRPEKRNPIGPQSLGELVHALGEAKEDAGARVIIITGAGKAFSAGGDLSMLAGKSQGEDSVPPASLVKALTIMHELGKPIIAMVNGHALAGGLGLMVACDLVIASEEATFGTTEIKVGLWPMMITAEITRNIGRKRTLELMLTGKRIDAAEAERIGLINQSVPADSLAATTHTLAEQLASLSPSTLSRGLQSFYATQDMEYEAALGTLEAGLAELLSTADAREGLMAFLQKRKPEWQGR